MPNPNKTIRILLGTANDLRYNDSLDAYFDFLKSLIEKGYELEVIDSVDCEVATTIKDVEHLDRFRKSLRL